MNQPIRKRPAPPSTHVADKAAPVADDALPQEENDFLARGELGALLQQASKVHGPNVIRSAELRPRFKHIPTDIFSLDMGLFGGIPEGVISLIYGWAGSGKTTLCGRVIGQAQKKYPDMAAVFIDAEGTYQPEWGRRHGVDNTRMALVQPESGEQALDLARSLVKAEEVSVVVVDSLAALVPMKELDKSMEDLTVGEQGRLISRFCRVLQADLLSERKRGHRPAILWINQYRMKIGTMFGDPRTLPGGEAQHFAAAVKIEMKNKEVMGKTANGIQTVDYNEHAFKIAKNKVGTGVREGEFVMVRNPSNPLGPGFVDDARAVINWARTTGDVTGGGSSWRVGGFGEEFSRFQGNADYFYSGRGFFVGFPGHVLGGHRSARRLRPGDPS